MNTTTLSSILIPALINLAVLGLLLWRVSTFARALSENVRGELRVGREEARSAGRELRDEVSTNVKSMDEGLRRSLENHGALQKSHYEATLRHLQDLNETNYTAIDGLRSMFDSASKDLRVGNEVKLDDIPAGCTHVLSPPVASGIPGKQREGVV